MACIRHEFWKILERTGGKSDEPEVYQEQYKEFDKIFKSRLDI